jgi:hypothetical protein
MGLWDRFTQLSTFSLSRALSDGLLDAADVERLEPFITRCEGVKLYPRRSR